jgi:hypothetical protein
VASNEHGSDRETRGQCTNTSWYVERYSALDVLIDEKTEPTNTDSDLLHTENKTRSSCSSWNLDLHFELPRINRVREIRMRNAIGESTKIGSQ